MEELFPQFNSGEQQLVADLTPDELTVLTKALRKVVTTAEGLGADTSA